MPAQTGPQLAIALVDALDLATPPLAITFSDAPPEGVAPFDDPMPDATPRRPHGPRARRLRVLDEGAPKRTFCDRRRGPRQLLRRQPDPRLQDARRGRRQLRRRRAARVRLGDDGRRAADPGRVRAPRRGHVRAARRRRRSTPTSCCSASTGKQLMVLLRRGPGPAHRRQAAVPHRRDRQGGRARSRRASAARSAACAPACRRAEMTCAIPASSSDRGVGATQRGRRRRGRGTRRRPRRFS